MKVLELFSGTECISNAFRKRGHECYTVDWDKRFPSTLHIDIMELTAVKMFAVAKIKGLRLIMENPWSEQTFLKQNFPFSPTFVDNNRLLRGDYYVKPTAYWFVNSEPTYGRSLQPRKKGKNICQIEPNRIPGICNEERSLISPDYARNFICDFIIGKEQRYTERSLFEM